MSEKKPQPGRQRHPKLESGGNGDGNWKTPDLLVGLDIGYGCTKIIREDGHRVIFPADVAAIPPTILSRIGNLDDEVVVERVQCIVGERAIGVDPSEPSPAIKA